MNQVTTCSIQHTDQIVKCATNIHIADVDMPMFVSRERLLKTLTFATRCTVSPLKATCLSQHTVNRCRAGRNNISIHHHVREPTIAFVGLFGMEGENRLLFPLFQPMVAWYECIVFIHFSIPPPPVIKLACADADPFHQISRRQFGPLAPLPDVIDDFVAHIMRNPSSV